MENFKLRTTIKKYGLELTIGIVVLSVILIGLLNRVITPPKPIYKPVLQSITQEHNTAMLFADNNNFEIKQGVNLSYPAIDIMYDIRSVIDRPLTITSNCRTVEYNRLVGGKENSKHLTCQAIDLRLWGVTSDDINKLKYLEHKRYNVVVESDHIHIEME